MNMRVDVRRPTVEQRVVAEIRATAEDTVSAWTDLPAGCLDVNWGEVGLLALQHRVEGLLHESLELAGCADQVPVSMLSTLRRRADLAETRYRACYDALLAVAGRAPELVAEMVFFKGADLAGRYASPAHRMVRDFDVIVPDNRADDVRRVFGELDFWEKPGRHGPMFVGSVKNPQIGSEYVVFDVHIDRPAGDGETGRSSRWLEAAVPAVIGEVTCRRLPPGFALLELLAHAGEHALSWIQVCLDNDVRLIRHLDVDVLCATGEIDAVALVELARRSTMEGQLAIGLAVHRAVRGGLPPVLEAIEAHADAVADIVDVVALPDGRMVEWTVPLHERAYRSDRAARALAMMPAPSRHRGQWFDWRRGLLNGAEDVAALTRRAARRLESRPQAS
jgi:hypothetical protein